MLCQTLSCTSAEVGALVLLGTPMLLIRKKIGGDQLSGWLKCRERDGLAGPLSNIPGPNVWTFDARGAAWRGGRERARDYRRAFCCQYPLSTWFACSAFRTS